MFYLKTSVVTFIANVCYHVWANIRITNHTNTVMLFAQPAQCNTRLFSAKYEIRMMLRHFYKSAYAEEDTVKVLSCPNSMD